MKPAIPYPAFSSRSSAQRVPSISRRASSKCWRSCARDFPNKLISRRLNISAATVKCHISRILDELGVSSRLQAVVVAARFGLIADGFRARHARRHVSYERAREAGGERSVNVARFLSPLSREASEPITSGGTPMTLQQFQKQLETLEQEADAVFSLLSSMPTWRLHMLDQVISDELAFRAKASRSTKRSFIDVGAPVPPARMLRAREWSTRYDLHLQANYQKQSRRLASLQHEAPRQETET